MPVIDFPRIRDLPEIERELFRDYLTGIECPVVNPELSKSEWDWYWPTDYRDWKLGRPKTPPSPLQD